VIVKRLVLRCKTTDEPLLVRRFPTVVSLEVKYYSGWGATAAMTDVGLRAVSSLASLTELNLSWCATCRKRPRGHASSDKVVTES
jgi:hypothetical protein